eukprot:3118635-Rhodomonas_salina.1
MTTHAAQHCLPRATLPLSHGTLCTLVCGTPSVCGSEGRVREWTGAAVTCAGLLPEGADEGE